jgi:aspartyl aminopeptidase
MSSNLGIRTVDIGNPQLSMHSIREMCGVEDTTHCINLLKAFFEEFVELDKTIKID